MKTQDTNKAPSRGDRILTLERKKRAFLIHALSFIGSAICLVFGTQNINEGYTLIGATELSVAVITIINLIYFFYSKRANIAAGIIGLIVISLGGFLVSTGGYHNTGLFWIYPLIAIAVLTNSFRVGLAYSLIFIVLCSFLLFIPNNPLLHTDYSLIIKVRFLTTLIVLLLLCHTAEYSQSQSRRQIRRLHNQLFLAANTDTLTQLHNRRHVFDNYFINGNLAGSDVHSILLCDVDHFKAINDSLGHDAGDTVLQEIARRFRQEIRGTDIIARWGGEEFLIILPSAAYGPAFSRAEKIRQAIASQPFNVEGTDYNVTISIGVASTGDDRSAQVLLKKADEQLYQAKAQGRNCTC